MTQQNDVPSNDWMDNAEKGESNATLFAMFLSSGRGKIARHLAEMHKMGSAASRSTYAYMAAGDMVRNGFAESKKLTEYQECLAGLILAIYEKQAKRKEG